MAVTAVWNLYAQHRPETTFWGVVISLVSLSFMWWLIRAKQRVGRELGSPAILADAECSRACMILSAVLLAASAGYELTGIGGLDALGALGIAWFSLREGREAFAEAKGLSCSCCTDDELLHHAFPSGKPVPDFTRDFPVRIRPIRLHPQS